MLINCREKISCIFSLRIVNFRNIISYSCHFARKLYQYYCWKSIRFEKKLEYVAVQVLSKCYQIYMKGLLLQLFNSLQNHLKGLKMSNYLFTVDFFCTKLNKNYLDKSLAIHHAIHHSNSLMIDLWLVIEHCNKSESYVICTLETKVPAPTLFRSPYGFFLPTSYVKILWAV